jgi:murein DD-endopeptidase MepM/ murein hydrolase activator NlpD
VLAAINEIETDYGRNLNVSSAGALGWMQFMPATWDMYGTDANRDGKADPYNPVDAIFAAARYLKAAGGHSDIRRAIFAYNHADWYVDSVMLRARVIAGYPADLVGSLTGLTEGRFPVAARARYADDVRESGADATERGIDIFTRKGAPAVAVNDGVIKKIGHSEERGHFVVLQDVYGNQYTYSGLGSVSALHPVPRDDAKRNQHAEVEAVEANDPKPKGAASAGTQRTDAPASTPAPKRKRKHVHGHDGAAPGQRVVAVKQRLFAHPQRPAAKQHGGAEQLLDRRAGNFETYDSYFSRPLGLNSRNATLRPLKVGSRVVASTVLGRVGDGGEGKAAHLHFEIRPAGKGAPKISPKPILDGWKLLESTAIYRASGKNALYGDGDFSVGELMLLPKQLLAKRILSDPRIEIYPGGDEDIRTGQIDRRVLVTIAYLTESGLHPTISSLKGNHGYLTASGNVSHHSSGNAVDISAINGTPLYGNQGAGSVTEQAVRRLMMLQGTLEPSQIISLLDFGANTVAMGDHDDHIHVGFQPLFGDNEQLGREAMSVLQPGQWDNLVERLGDIPNPTVPTKPSRYATPADDHGDE